MEKAGIKDFEKLDLRVGKIKAVKDHPKTRDYILLIDLGQAEQDMQIVADLDQAYKKEELIGRQVIYLDNIDPITIGGIESQGLLLITHQQGRPVLISPQKEVLTGVRIAGVRDSESYHHEKK